MARDYYPGDIMHIGGSLKPVLRGSVVNISVCL